MNENACVEAHSHLVDKLRIYCRSAYLVEFVDLLLTTDGNRQGFSFETLQELHFLREMHIDQWETLRTPFAGAEQDTMIKEARQAQLQFERHGAVSNWK